MKTRQHAEAKRLYFTTDMSKTEIANIVGVNRRTILLWSKKDSWAMHRKISRHNAARLAERCYSLIDNFTSYLLQNLSGQPVSLYDAQTIHLLAASIKKLKNKGDLFESRKLFGSFHKNLKKHNPKLAADVLPKMEEYIATAKDHEYLEKEIKAANHDQVIQNTLQNEAA